VARRERLVVGRDLGLAVELQDEGDLAGKRPEVFLREPDLERDGGKAALQRQPELELRVEALRIDEEVPRPVLEPLVNGEDHQAAVARPVFIEEAGEPRLLPGGEIQVLKGHKPLRHACAS